MSYKFIVNAPKITDENRQAVYMLTFDCGMFYIGSSINLARRIIQYRYNFYNRHDINKKLKAALNSHNSVTLTIIEVCQDEKTLRTREDFYIKENFSNPLLLNRSVSAFSNRTVHFTDEERWALGHYMRGRKLTPEQRKLWSNVKKGAIITPEHRQKISIAKKGKPFSDEHKANLSIAKKGKPKTEKWLAVMKGKGAKKVDKFDLAGNFITTYNSYSEAAKSIGCLAGHIGEVVNGKYPHRNGYVFKPHTD